MKKVLLFILLLSTLVAVVPTVAQDTKETCDIASLQDLMDTFSAALQKVKDGKPTDPIKVSDFLQTAANAANATRAYCDGLAFSGNKQLVIGPVTIPEGVYRAKATTKGYLIVHVDALSGECGVGVRYSSQSLFNISEGEANDGAEAVFASKKCSALITVENVREDWQIVFERITTD